MINNGPGRPSNVQVLRRRRKVIHYLVASAWTSDTVVEAIAEKLRVSPAAIRADLDALKEEFARSPEAPDLEDAEALIQRYLRAKSGKSLLTCDKILLGKVLSGKLDPVVGRTVKEISVECRQKLKLKREEEASLALCNLAPMTRDQYEAFLGWLESQAPKPLAPGETVPPPGAAPPPSPPPSASAPS